MTGPGKDRLDVIASINAVRYREYARVAWLKAGVIGRREAVTETERQALRSYTQDGDRSLVTCLYVIDIFSEEVFLYHTPESMSRPVHAADFQPVEKDRARQFVDDLVRASEGVEQPGVDYTWLTAYFFDELFDAQRAGFFAALSRYEKMHTAVAGMDNEVIGLFWLA